MNYNFDLKSRKTTSFTPHIYTGEECLCRNKAKIECENIIKHKNFNFQQNSFTLHIYTREKCFCETDIGMNHKISTSAYAPTLHIYTRVHAPLREKFVVHDL
jgi:hypothetical protein